MIDNYSLVYDKWQCVITFGGDNKSIFYVGDLDTEPQYIGSVDCDICGQVTYRIGNQYEGPGDIGCMIVFDKHKSMQTLIQLYYHSILSMAKHWNQNELNLIEQILMQHLKVDGLIVLVFQFIFSTLLSHFNL